MKYVVVIGLSIASLALAYMQETSSSKKRVSSSIGLKVGQNAPAFASRDQFGDEQSIETLKGSNGTVLASFLPLRRLVTLLQSATRAAAKC